MRRILQLSFLKTLLDSLQEPIFYKDANLKYIGCNKAFEIVLGLKSEELSGKSVHDVAPKELADIHHKADVELIQSSKSQSYEAQIQFADGKYRDVIFQKSIFYNEDGSPGGIVGILIDITEKKQTETELLEFSRVVEQNPDAVVITDIDGNIEYVNPKFTELTGYTSEEIIGKNSRILKSGEMPAEEYTKLWKTITAGGEWRGEFHNKKKNGEFYWESASISAIRDSSGKIIRFMAIGQDTTERKRIESELIRLASYPLLNPFPIIETDSKGIVTYLNPAARITFPQLLSLGNYYPWLDAPHTIIDETLLAPDGNVVKELEFSGRVYEQRIFYVPEIGRLRIYLMEITERKKIDQLKNDFVSTVSHELRTPLSITKEGINLILDNIAGPISDKQRHILTTSNNNIDRLSRIINSLLDISKMESGSVTLKKDLINITSLVASTAESFTLRAKDKGLKIVANVPGHEVWLYVDSDKIAQVLINLIGNAIKFSSKGEVVVTLEDDAEKVVVSVKDTGCGIPVEALGRIFNKFQQFGRKDGAGEKGTGLGLSIAKGLVEIHEGRIWFNSEENKGSEFFFSLPKFPVEEMLSKHLVHGMKRALEHNQTFSLITVTFSGFSSSHINPSEFRKFRDDMKLKIQDCLRSKNDVVFELPDYFTVMLEGCNKDRTQQIADRIGESLHEFLSHNKVFKSITPSTGNAIYPGEAISDDDLLKIALANTKPWEPKKTKPGRRVVKHYVSKKEDPGH